MEAVFFWVLATALLICATAVVLFRNPVTNAVCLVAGLAVQAALFVTLEANFLAAVQVIVYAGAVMVLFLFVIMLLDVREEARRTIPWVKVGGVGVVVLAAGLGIPRVVEAFPSAKKSLHWGGGAVSGSARDLGMLLFQGYGPLFLATGVLLLVATIGVVVLCRRDPEV
jgi:NADH-quinone oxidoreductase subunit J